MNRRNFLALGLGAIAITIFVGTKSMRGEEGGQKKFKGRYGHDNVFQERNSGNILSLSKVVELVRPKINGEIIETEFEYEHGLPVYEFKYIDKTGRLMEVYVDARNGAVISEESD